MQNLIQDLRYGLRLLRRQPLFTLVAILTLGLGIGANTAVFTVVDAALLRSLPYRDPQRLVHLWESSRHQPARQREASYPDYLDIKQNSQLFEGVAGYNGRNLTLSRQDGKERVQAVRVSANFFSLLGAEAMLGRTFVEDEDRPGAPAVVVLSHGFWQRRFGADPELIGQALDLNGTNYTVIGILPPQFKFAPINDGELWIPLNPSTNEVSRRFMHWLRLIARLRPGVSPESAATGVEAIGKQFQEADPQNHEGATIKLLSLQEEITGPAGAGCFPTNAQADCWCGIKRKWLALIFHLISYAATLYGWSSLETTGGC